MTSTSIFELLIKDTSKIIRQRYSDCQRTINFGTISLFWEIGSKLNDYFNTKYNSTDDDLLMGYLSETLSDNFGPFLRKKNLLIMRKFASVCSHETLVLVASFINWRYIPYLLTLNSQDQWIYYIRLINLEHLTVDELEEKISKKLFEQSGLEFKDPTQAFTDVIFSNNNGIDLPIENYFSGNNADTFRLLFEPLENSSRKLEPSFQESTVELNLIILFASKVYQYQRNYNNWLNTVFNLSFWTLGHVILQSLNKFGKDVNKDTIISNLSENLTKQFGELFNKEQIYNSIEFKKQFDDLILANEFAEKITWEHIQILLPVTTLEAKLFYAKQVLEKRIDTKTLAQIIQSNSHESPYDKDYKVIHENITDATISEITISMSKNATLKINKIASRTNYVEKSELVYSTYKNPELMTFMNIL